MDVRVRPGEAVDVFESRGSVAEDRFRELLGLIIAQAFHDGMSAVKLGVDRGTQRVYLRYYGPGGAPDARWWDMTAPPADAYLGLVKAAVEVAEFASGLDPRGTIHGQVNRQAVDVRVEFSNWEELTLAWGADEHPGAPAGASGATP